MTKSTTKNTGYNYVQIIALGGLLIAIEIILDRFLEIGGNTFRYSFAFVARAISGHLFGPLWTAVFCLIADVTGAMIKFGYVTPLLSVTAILRGLVYGLFFYKKKINLRRIIPCVLVVEMFCGLVVNSTILYYMFVAAKNEKSLMVYIGSRAMQAVVMTAVEIPVLTVLGRALIPQLDRLLEQMRYNTLKKVNKVITPGSKLGLSRVSEFAALLGNPEQRLKLIHVAGTNGKGSTSNMIADALIAEGYKVGIFNSPYLSTPVEYFNINNKLITDRDFQKLTKELSSLVETHTGKELSEAPTEFEFYTCAALKYYAEQGCDFAVLEVGMGGRDDATNFISAPELCVITNLGMDHEGWLGNSLKEIAEHKAGIIKKGCSLVAYPAADEVKAVFEAKAEAEGVKVVFADFERLKTVREGWDNFTTNVEYTTAKGNTYTVCLNSPALYQTRNAALALEALDVLKNRGIIISDKSIEQGFESFMLPARFEIISAKPLIIADGGHNPQCIENGLESLKLLAAYKKVTVLTGVMRDKDYSKMYDLINEVADEYVVVSNGTERAMTTAELKAVLEPYGKKITVAKSPAEGAALAKSQLTENDCLYITGTLYVMDEIRKELCR